MPRTKTTKPKTAAKPKQIDRQDLGESQKVLYESLGGESFRHLMNAGDGSSNDTSLTTLIRTRWNITGEAPARAKDGPAFCVSTYDPRWGMAIWIRTDTPFGDPDYSTSHEHASGSRNLLRAVREIYQLQEPRPDTTSTTTPSGIAANDPDTELAVETNDDIGYQADIEIERLSPSGMNPRKHFDPEAIKELAKSLRLHGQLQNVTVRPVGNDPNCGQYELIGGERRYRAALEAGLPTLRCRVIRCDDATAVELCGIENYRREQLNAVEEGIWFQQMMDTGRYENQAALAEYLGISQGQVSNRLRLLKLPEAWQKQVIDGRLPASHARALVAWADRDCVLSAVADRLEIESVDPKDLPLTEWESVITNAVHNVTKDMSSPYKGPRFEVTEELIKQLDVVEVPERHSSSTCRRAFNTALYDQLQAAAPQRSQFANDHSPKSGDAGDNMGDDDDGDDDDDEDGNEHSPGEPGSVSSRTDPATNSNDVENSTDTSETPAEKPSQLTDWQLVSHFQLHVGQVLSGKLKADALPLRMLITSGTDETLEPFIRWLQSRAAVEADNPPDEEDTWEATEQLEPKSFVKLVHEFMTWALAEGGISVGLPTLMHAADVLKLDPLKTWTPDAALLGLCSDSQLRELFTDEMAPPKKVDKWGRKRLIDEALATWPEGYRPALLTPHFLMGRDMLAQ